MKKLIHPADLGFLIIVAAYVAASWALCIHAHQQARFMPLMYLGTGAQFTLMFLLAYIFYRLLRAAWIMIAQKPKYLTRAIIEDLKRGPLRLEIWRRAAPIVIGFIFFFSTFTSMKFLIADIKPFAWDQFLMHADKTIHFGMDPWRILQPALGHPIVTQIIAFFYILWLPVFFLVLYWQLFRFQNEELRMRFFYTFALMWAINGTFLAVYFSSAGPCYFQHVTHSGYYKPLMDYLLNANKHYKIFSVDTQKMLWDNYLHQSNILGGGVSAFPSVHVGTAFLFVLMARHISDFWTWIFGAFFLAILIGSIHLGWHYAVDGYAAIIMTAILWKFSNFLLKNFLTQSKTKFSN